jgi:hypothetical protein
LETHEIIDIWSVGENITALDSHNFEDGGRYSFLNTFSLIYFIGTVFAIGCANGKIFLRIDWEEYPRCYECSKENPK